MAARRILALAIAVLLLVGAVVLRNARDGGDGGGGDEGPAAPARLHLTCTTELADTCDALRSAHPELDVVVADGVTTADTLLVSGTDRPATDGWLTLAPLPALVDGARARAGRTAVLSAASPPLARSPLVLVMWVERTTPLAAACGPDGVTWPCIGDHAGRPWPEVGGPAVWGDLEPGHARPDASATGLLVLGQAVVAQAGTTSPDIGELDGGALRTWLRQLERAVPAVAAPGATPLAQAMAAGPSTYDVIGTTEAEATTTLARSARGTEMGVLYPAPMATADVVYAPTAGAAGAGVLGDLVADEVGALLQARGWRSPTDPRTLPVDGNGLPEADVLEAVLATWGEVVR